MKKKLYAVLSEALGTDDLIIMISAQLQDEEKKIKEETDNPIDDEQDKTSEKEKV
ncbi:MAG: hypothetical protein K6357_00765 [Elusimicrobiota bacterium]